LLSLGISFRPRFDFSFLGVGLKRFLHLVARKTSCNFRLTSFQISKPIEDTFFENYYIIVVLGIHRDNPKNSNYVS
jgi:hypothetical protein